MKFLGDGCAAGLGPALKNKRLESSFREIERGDESVVTAADDDHIAGLRHQAAPLMSLRISSAAKRPGAPMIPPPGCVAEPHIYKFLIGVRNCAYPGTGRRKNNRSSDNSP